jgi:hypothetical protein
MTAIEPSVVLQSLPLWVCIRSSKGQVTNGLRDHVAEPFFFRQNVKFNFFSAIFKICRKMRIAGGREST